MSLTASDYAAWWGATVATVMLVMDVRNRLRQKPKIQMRTKFTKEIGGERRKCIIVELANVGEKATTITSVYAHSGHGKFMRPNGDVVTVPSNPVRHRLRAEDRFSLPYLLEPANVWVGHIDPDSMEYVNQSKLVIIKVRDERGIRVAKGMITLR